MDAYRRRCQTKLQQSPLSPNSLVSGGVQRTPFLKGCLTVGFEKGSGGERAVEAETQPGEFDRSVLVIKTGDVQLGQGDLTAALTSYCAALEIREQLAQQDPGNATLQRGLSVNHGRMGGIWKCCFEQLRSTLRARQPRERLSRSACRVRRAIMQNKTAEVRLQPDLNKPRPLAIGLVDAVGTGITPRPLRRSRRALLTHRAPPSGRT